MASILTMFGFLNCNKPVGFTSRDLVNVVQGRIRGRKVKVGHCGTLDPLADGVLVVGVGPAAKLVPYVHQLSKRYAATFRLGAESPTGDLEVEPTVLADQPRPSIRQLSDAADGMIGEVTQTPPVYSAIKIDGRRAYDLARQGRPVEVPSRTVKIESIDVVSYDYPTLKLDITCGTGTYIRSLGIDLARAVGTTAVMSALTRTGVGSFRLSDAVSIDQLREHEIGDLLLSPTRGVEQMTRLTIDDDEATRLSHGLCLEPSSSDGIGPTEAAAVTADMRLRAIVIRKDGRWCPKKVFPDL